MRLVENLTKFANITSIHGLVFIANSRSTVKKITWFLLFVSSLIYAGFQIASEAHGKILCLKRIFIFTIFLKTYLFSEWRKFPTKIVVETLAHPIENVSFPTVTICPQNSNSDRWGSTIKVLDYFKRSCSING